MRGIAGLLTTAAALDVRERLDAMLGRSERAARVVRGAVGFGASDPAWLASEADERVWTAHEGEALDAGELRRGLAASGHRFEAGGAAEAILRGYEQWGAAGLAGRLEGHVAFCVWNERRRVAHVAGDRLGARPVFYVARASGLAFSTSLRAVARSGLCLPKLDEEALWSHLCYGHAAGERTLLAGVLRLPAGHVLTWEADSGILTVEPFGPASDDEPSAGIAPGDALARVRDRVAAAVRRAAPGGAPVACLAPGDLGSALVAATADLGDRPAIVVSDASAGDAPGVGTIAAVDEWFDGLDEPVADPLLVPSLLLARAARGRAGVVLTGAGADEIFGTGAHVAAAARPRPAPAGAERLEEARGRSALRRRFAERVGAVLPPPRPGAASPNGFPRAAQPELLWCLLGADRRPSLERFREMLDAVEARALAGAAGSPFDRVRRLDLTIGLARRLAAALREPARAYDLDLRAPLADPRLVALAAALPAPLLVDERGAGRLLREAAGGLVPPDALEPPADPLDAALRVAADRIAREALGRSALVDDGVLSRRGIDALLAARADLGLDVGQTIWALAAVERWWRRVREEVVAALPERGAIPVLDAGREPAVDLVIAVHERLNLVRDCVRSIRAFTGRQFRAVLVDDASCAATHERLCALAAGDARFEVVRCEEQLGWARASERAVAASTADYVVVLDPDTVVAPGWLERMVACAESDPTIGVVLPLTNEAGCLSVRMAPGLTFVSMARRVAEVSRRDYPDVAPAADPGCMLLRRSAVELLGGFDAALAPGASAADLCARYAGAGLRVVAADDAWIYHKGTVSPGGAAGPRVAGSRRDPLQYMRDRLLAGTVGAAVANAGLRTRIEARLDRLETRTVLAATGDGARAAAAAALLPERAPVAGRVAFREWAAARRERTASAGGARPLVFPTRRYVAGLPAAEPGALRVTFLVSSLPLAGGVISILHVARELMLAGHDVKFATEAHEVVPELLNLWVQPLVFRDREHLVRDFPASDVVVATWWATAFDYLPELRRRHRFVAAYYVQDYEPLFYPETEAESRRDARRSYQCADHFVFASQWIADRVGPHPGDAEVIPLDVDLDVFYPRGNRGARPRVVSVAEPGTEKRRRGFPETAEAYRRIHEARPDVELVFFGADPAAMPDLPFPYTNLGRLYDQNRVAEIVSSSHVLVDASLWQGFGRPGLEALACGTVPVLTGVGGVHEYARDGENCLLTPSGDPAAVADAVLAVLGDDTLRERLSANGPPAAAPFSHRLIGARHLALYERWVKDSRR